MKISLTKQSGHVVLTCTRADGSVTWQKSAHGGFFGAHDLLHYAVETTLGLRESFFGLIAAGRAIELFSAPGTATSLPAEALHTELMVNQLMIGRNFDDYADGEAFNKTLIESWQKSNHRGHPPPSLTDDQLAAIRRCYEELLADWERVPAGGKLELQFHYDRRKLT